MGDRIVIQCGQDILRAICLSVDNILDAFVALSVPDLDDFVRTETDQMISLLVDIEVAY